MRGSWGGHERWGRGSGGPRGPECRRAAALYRAVRTELQRGRPGPLAATRGPQRHAWRRVTASRLEAGFAPSDARALPRTCFGWLLPLKGCDLRVQPGPDRCVDTEAAGCSCKTRERLYSLNLGGTFPFQPLSPKISISPQPNSAKPSNLARRAIIFYCHVWCSIQTLFTYNFQD